MKTMVILAESGAIEKVDTIEYDGKLWLVPNWLDQRGIKRTRPNRLIRMDALPHQKAEIQGCQYVLNAPVPNSLFEMTPLNEKAKGYEVLELPELWFELRPSESQSKN